MFAYTIKRILQIIPVLLVISFLVFFMVHLMPGDPVQTMLGTEATPEQVEIYREALGLNDPIHIQYFNYMKGLLRGDMGTSFYTNNPVSQEIAERYPNTLKIAVLATMLASALGVTIGIAAAVKHNQFMDNLLMVLSMISVSMPSFFFALLLMLVFSQQLNILPSLGLSSGLHYILPTLTLGLNAVGLISRTTRSAMLDVLRQDYIRTSKSRGIRKSKITFSHALKNALIPVVTVIGLRFGTLLAGATLTETVFSIPGMGRFLVTSVLNRDYPSIQGCILVLASTYVIINTVVDLLYGFIDPRIKYV